MKPSPTTRRYEMRASERAYTRCVSMHADSMALVLRHPQTRSYYTVGHGWVNLVGFSTGVVQELFSTPIYSNASTPKVRFLAVAGNVGAYACANSCQANGYAQRATRLLGSTLSGTTMAALALATPKDVKTVAEAMYSAYKQSRVAFNTPGVSIVTPTGAASVSVATACISKGLAHQQVALSLSHTHHAVGFVMFDLAQLLVCPNLLNTNRFCNAAPSGTFAVFAVRAPAALNTSNFIGYTVSDVGTPSEAATVNTSAPELWTAMQQWYTAGSQGRRYVSSGTMQAYAAPLYASPGGQPEAVLVAAVPTGQRRTSCQNGCRVNSYARRAGLLSASAAGAVQLTLRSAVTVQAIAPLAQTLYDTYLKTRSSLTSPPLGVGNQNGTCK